MIKDTFIIGRYVKVLNITFMLINLSQIFMVIRVPAITPDNSSITY
jgi:hypothetical protein